MPLFHLVCTRSECGLATRRLMEPKDVATALCGACGGALKRDPKPPTTQVVEKLDNGVMSRRVERLANAENLYKDRSRNSPDKKE